MESSIYWFTSHMQRELILIYTEDTVTTKSHAKGVNSYTFFFMYTEDTVTTYYYCV